LYAVVLIGVGCETDDAKEMAEQIRLISDKPIFAAIVQEDGGGDAVIDKAVQAAKRFLKDAQTCERVQIPVSGIVFGTECGGSDALSGITANPTIGRVSDWSVENGGTVLLSETAEFFGTEDILAARAISPEIGERIRKMIYKEEIAVRKYMGEQVSRIIARGNMAGGITTIQEKALGCIRKGGTSTIIDVIEYGDPIGNRRGLVIMNGPGYDPVSLTGMFASGAQVFMFSTGRGNPLGFPAAPCIKICSNSQTYQKVGGIDGDMDINAGLIADGAMSTEELGKVSIQYLLDVCEGKQTKPEMKKYGGTVCVYQDSPPF
jgi:altronate dehydratase large subunit